MIATGVRRLLAGLAMVLGLGAAARPAGEVRISGGNVLYAEGPNVWSLTADWNAEEGALSPDGQTVAWTRLERGPDHVGIGTSLMLVDRATRTSRVLLLSTPHDDLKQDLRVLRHPTWSLDGGFVYVMAEAWATSDAIHQVNVRTGAHKYVIDGTSLSVIRNGPYRGMLLVSRHLYHDAPEYGSYEPTFVVRPDGHVVLKVPGSDDDDAAVTVWLKKNGWEAW